MAMAPTPACIEVHDPRFAPLVLFNDIPNNRTLRWSEQHGVSTFLEPSAFANGQTRDLQGRLIQCLHHSLFPVHQHPRGAV